MTATGSVVAARSAAAGVADPEIPVLSIDDLGILRDVAIEGDGTVTVTITPTYSGCPAMGQIRSEIVSALNREGFERVEIVTTLSPPWTTDWMTPVAREKLASYGIAPPGPAEQPRAIRCPRCTATATDIVSEFGSTACKSLMVCRACGEPFDYFKEI